MPFFLLCFSPLVVALVYDVERRRGKKDLLAQPCHKALVLGKTIARGVLVGGAALFLLSAGLAIAGVSFDSVEVLRSIFCAGALVVAWGALWFSAGIFVNSFGLSSANNALILVGGWISLVVILPGLLLVSISTFMPSVSSIHVMHEIREAGQKANAD